MTTLKIYNGHISKWTTQILSDGVTRIKIPPSEHDEINYHSKNLSSDDNIFFYNIFMYLFNPDFRPDEMVTDSDEEYFENHDLRNGNRTRVQDFIIEKYIDLNNKYHHEDQNKPSFILKSKRHEFQLFFNHGILIDTKPNYIRIDNKLKTIYLDCYGGKYDPIFKQISSEYHDTDGSAGGIFLDLNSYKWISDNLTYFQNIFNNLEK